MSKIFLALAVTLLFGATLCGAAAAADIKLGYINMLKVEKESVAGKQALTTLENMANDKQAKIQERRKEIEKMQKELDKQSSIISADERQRREDKLQKEYKNYQRYYSDSQDELSKKKEELANKMFDEVTKVIKKYGKEEGYTIILDRSVVLYAPQAVDITDKIIKAYDDTKETKQTKEIKK
ncbi:MAG: OmpH/Skp family outer membrane protein [Nitrospirota bacterium]